MSDLSFKEKERLEKIYEMSSGFVMNFSNKTFKEFILYQIPSLKVLKKIKILTSYFWLKISKNLNSRA